MAGRTLAQKALGRLRLHVADPLVRRARRWRHAGESYSPVFVAGAMGSGTTLLALAMRQHLELSGVVEESALEVGGFLRVPPVARHDSIDAYLRALEPQPDWDPELGREILQDLYRSRASSTSGRVVDKGPNATLVRAAFLARCFPDAPFLAIFRDPVANVEGFRRKWPLFGRAPLSESIRFYREIHERFLRDGEAFRERILVIAYEGLVQDYGDTLDRIAARAKLRRRGGSLSLRERPNVPGQGVRNVADGEIHLVRDANEQAYRTLGEDAIRQIREELGPLEARLRSRAINA